MIPLILFLALQQPQAGCVVWNGGLVCDSDKPKVMCAAVDGCGYEGGRYVGFGFFPARFQQPYNHSQDIVDRPYPRDCSRGSFLYPLCQPENLEDWLMWQHLDYLERHAPPQIKAICGEQMECMHSGHAVASVPRKPVKRGKPIDPFAPTTDNDWGVASHPGATYCFWNYALNYGECVDRNGDTVPKVKKPAKKAKKVDPFKGGTIYHCGEKKCLDDKGNEYPRPYRVSGSDHPVYEQRLVPGECAAHGGWQNGCDPVYAPMIVPPPPLPKGLQR